MLTSTRDSVLDAALELLVQEGANSLTLERVARDAGISKGGLLYHYAGKEQLVQGLIELLTTSLEQGQAAWLARSDRGPGSYTRSFLQAALQGDPGEDRSLRGYEIAAILLAAMASTPELLNPLRKRYREWQNAFDHDGIEPLCDGGQACRGRPLVQ